jgi:hypothetical protein
VPSNDGALSRDYVFVRRSELCCGADMGAVSAIYLLQP